jgi:GNAT superfamily N-acetyltransferase
MNTKEKVKWYADEVLVLRTKVGYKEAYRLSYPMNLPISVRQAIFDDFYPVAVTAFGQNKSEAFQKDVEHHLFGVDNLVLVFNDGIQYKGEGVERGIAFRTYSVIQTPYGKALYVEGTAVDPAFQGLGLYQALMKATSFGYAYVTSRTQNPVVLTALYKIYERLAPVMDVPTVKERKVALAVAKFLKMKEFDEKTLVGRKTYGGRLNDRLPNISNDVRNRLYKLINPDDGDCVIAVCSKMRKAQRKVA